MDEVEGLETNIHIQVELQPSDSDFEMEVDSKSDEMHSTSARVEADNDVEDGELSETKSSIDCDQRKDKEIVDTVPIVPGSNDASSENTERPPRRYPNPFLSSDGKKLSERAARFHINSPNVQTNEKNPTSLDTMSEEQLLGLYNSCGILSDVWDGPSFDKVIPNIRLDSLLIRGINDMSTNEIFGYLHGLGLLPHSMEWVNDACCIAVFHDKYEAGLSLLRATKAIGFAPKLDKKSSLTDDQQSEKHRENETEMLDYDSFSVIPYEKIRVPMPLGYVWRFAKPCDKAKGILMRFATTSDKKQQRAEALSEYYKKHGNPNKPVEATQPGKRKINNVWANMSAQWTDLPADSRDIEKYTSPKRLKFKTVKYSNTSDLRGTIKSSFQQSTAQPGVRNWQSRFKNRLGSFVEREEDEWNKRLKRPKMTMRADEEERKRKTPFSRLDLSAKKPSVLDRLGCKLESEEDDDDSPQNLVDEEEFCIQSLLRGDDSDL